jgi:hypothetical protein
MLMLLAKQRAHGAFLKVKLQVAKRIYMQMQQEFEMFTLGISLQS